MSNVLIAKHTFIKIDSHSDV